MTQINAEQLKLPQYSSLNRATSYFDCVFEGVLDDTEVWVAGGAFRAYFQRDEKLDDIDLFTTNRTEAAKVIGKLRKHFNFTPYFINKNAIKGHIVKKGKKIKVDVVKRFYENSEQCIKDFDFSVSKFAYHLKSKYICHTECYFPDLISKRLVIPDVEYGNPLGSMKRLQKYIKKGYTACNGTLITISKRLAEIDLNNPDVNDIEYYPDGRLKILLFD